MSTTITGSGVTTSLVTADDITVDTNTIVIDTTNDRVGINKASPTVALDVTGAITASGTVTANSFSGDGSSLTGISAGLWSDIGSRTATFGQSTLVLDGTLVTINAGSNARYVRGTVSLGVANIGYTQYFDIIMKQKSGWIIAVPTQENATRGFNIVSEALYNWPLGRVHSIVPQGNFGNNSTAYHISEAFSDNLYKETAGTLTTHVNDTVGLHYQTANQPITVYFEGYMEPNGQLQWGVDNNDPAPIELAQLVYMLIDV